MLQESFKRVVANAQLVLQEVSQGLFRGLQQRLHPQRQGLPLPQRPKQLRLRLVHEEGFPVSDFIMCALVWLCQVNCTYRFIFHMLLCQQDRTVKWKGLTLERNHDCIFIIDNCQYLRCFPDKWNGPDSKAGSRCQAQKNQKYCKSVQGDCRHIAGACPPERSPESDIRVRDHSFCSGVSSKKSWASIWATTSASAQMDLQVVSILISLILN